MSSTTLRLLVMMFLQFFIWGAWYVTLGPYMGAMRMGAGIGDAYTVGPLAAILAPFFVGMIADRFFATQRILGFLHLIGGLALVLAPVVANATPVREVMRGGEMMEVRNHYPFVGLLLAHMLCYMPTLGLTNSLAFHHLENREKQFPLVRVLGTIGWIVAGFVVGFAIQLVVPRSAIQPGPLLDEKSAEAALNAARAASPVFFHVAGVAAFALGLFSFVLPHTPPPAAGQKVSARDVLGLDALSLLKSRNFAVFLVCSFFICIPLAAYYAFAGVYLGQVGVAAAWVPRVMTLGQISEVFFMLLMPLLFLRLGVRWMLLIGMLAWVVRYGLFAGAWPPGNDGNWLPIGMVITGIVLHGICYDFFFVTGQVYVDQKANPRIRAQAQGMLVLVTLGLGLGIGAQVIGAIHGAYTHGDLTNWQNVWIWPCVMAATVLVVFFALFRGEGGASKERSLRHKEAKP